MATLPRALTVTVNDRTRVSALLLRPARARACFVFAHGAGAGMTHPFMANVADQLAARGIATLRYQFPYMERQSKRPDSPALCHATIRAAVAIARKLAPKLPLIAGGKSFGGRMTSQAQAAEPLADVLGLAFFGFPLHPPKQPSIARAEHLSLIKIPTFFIQGTRDALADPTLLQALVKQLGSLSTLLQVPEADHSFHVPARSGRTDSQVMDEVLEAFVAWITSLIKK
jgi:uncharacterized protein